MTDPLSDLITEAEAVDALRDNLTSVLNGAHGALRREIGLRPAVVQICAGAAELALAVEGLGGGYDAGLDAAASTLEAALSAVRVARDSASPVDGQFTAAILRQVAIAYQQISETCGGLVG